MSDFVQVVNEPQEIRSQIYGEVNDIAAIVKKGLPCLVGTGDEARTLMWAPSVVGSSVRPGLAGSVRRIILDACQKGERIGPGSSELILSWSVALAQEYLTQIISGRDARECEEELQEASGCFLESGLLGAKWLPQNDFQNQIELLSGHPKAASLVWEAIQLAGMESRIFVDAEPSDSCLVELSRGFHFEVGSYEELIGERARWAERQVRVAVIDGTIESVSEIHLMLEPSSRDIEPVVIFARGFAEEVIGTLTVNRMRETLNIIPIRVPFDEYSANMLKDIAVVCNTHVVSSLTGDLISNIHFDDLAVVDRVICTHGKTEIHNDSGLRGAASLSHELTSRRQKAKSDALINLLDFRLRSLSSMTTRIRYDRDFLEFVPEIDLLLRTSRAILDSGVVDLTVVRENSPACFQNALAELIDIARTPHGIPALTLLATIKHGTQAAISLLSINAALLLDKGK